MSIATSVGFSRHTIAADDQRLPIVPVCGIAATLYLIDIFLMQGFEEYVS
jgi:hypothetical protein